MISACRKDEMNTMVQTPIYNPPTTEEPGSFSGLVTDSNEIGIEGVTVNFNSEIRITDEDGRFSYNDISVHPEGTYVTFNKVGYFSGSRKFYPITNQKSNLKVELIQLNLSGSIETDLGGDIINSNNAGVSLPKGNYLKNEVEFSGSFDVFLKWLNPNREETSFRMPGDFEGVDLNGDQQALISYGMIAVELKDNEGNDIDLPEGETAEIRIPVPINLIFTAPSIIPLWYFDTFSGTWIEEGEAILEGDEYVAEVSHFSFWNCAISFPISNLSGQININNQPVGWLKYVITDLETGIIKLGITDDHGFVNIKLPQSKPILVEFFDFCEESISIFSLDMETEIIFPEVNLTLSNNASSNFITGKVISCSGDSILYPMVYVDLNGDVGIHYAESDGSFSIEVNSCTDLFGSIIAVDPTNNLFSDYKLIKSSDDLFVGELETCIPNFESENFIHIDYEGQTYNSGLNFFPFGLFGSVEELPVADNEFIYLINGFDIFESKELSATVNYTEGDSEGFMEFHSDDGFVASGIINVETNPILSFHGTLYDIEITDNEVYPEEGVEEVFLIFSFD